MTCPRCAAMMVHQCPLKYYSQNVDTSDTLDHGHALRCYACGNYLDRTILSNRQTRRRKRVVAS